MQLFFLKKMMSNNIKINETFYIVIKSLILLTSKFAKMID